VDVEDDEPDDDGDEGRGLGPKNGHQEIRPLLVSLGLV